MTEQDR